MGIEMLDDVAAAATSEEVVSVTRLAEPRIVEVAMAEGTAVSYDPSDSSVT